ncbi:hypothetical protein HYDPIDRAFT_189459 [Hydnomerulius pinastri MD-312]|uniref:Unplaced genomic scaffold scaffold_27, whole genome shotgun sequence n=1 Tax=Hydnomerulius pinastri MD-312 TaxID=994086 RepID=A0A0C9V793_9AGAM|nr:hypothetical protein HYDPIDRAFT_189459 [Hydnomerulius pinastri MD-312]
MAAATQSQSQVPELTVLTRVASIPIVASSLDQIHSTLSSNALTRSPYHAAQVISQTAYNYSQPLQIRLAPLIVSANGYANKGLDVVEQKYPYPFNAKPEEVASYVRERRDSVMSSANKRFDQNVKSPAVGVAEGIDKRFAPIVDYFEIAVNKVGNESGSSSPNSTSSDCQYQYQRAYTLSKHLKDNLYVYSSEHLKQLQQQNALVQKATETANSIQSLASASITSAQARIHTLSDSMLQELQKLQQSTAALPQTLQSTYPDISKSVTELRNVIATPDMPVTDKVNRVGQEVKERVSPMLEKLQQRIGDLVNVLGTKKDEASGNATRTLLIHAYLPMLAATRRPIDARVFGLVWSFAIFQGPQGEGFAPTCRWEGSRMIISRTSSPYRGRTGGSNETRSSIKVAASGEQTQNSRNTRRNSGTSPREERILNERQSRQAKRTWAVNLGTFLLDELVLIANGNTAGHGGGKRKLKIWKLQGVGVLRYSLAPKRLDCCKCELEERGEHPSEADTAEGMSFRHKRQQALYPALSPSRPSPATSDGEKMYDYQMKGVGKTALITHFGDDAWDISVLPTIGIEFKRRVININDKRVVVTTYIQLARSAIWPHHPTEVCSDLSALRMELFLFTT